MPRTAGAARADTVLTEAEVRGRGRRRGSPGGEARKKPPGYRTLTPTLNPSDFLFPVPSWTAVAGDRTHRFSAAFPRSPACRASPPRPAEQLAGCVTHPRIRPAALSPTRVSCPQHPAAPGSLPSVTGIYCRCRSPANAGKAAGLISPKGCSVWLRSPSPGTRLNSVKYPGF